MFFLFLACASGLYFAVVFRLFVDFLFTFRCWLCFLAFENIVREDLIDKEDDDVLLTHASCVKDQDLAYHNYLSVYKFLFWSSIKSMLCYSERRELASMKYSDG